MLTALDRMLFVLQTSPNPQGLICALMLVLMLLCGLIALAIYAICEVYREGHRRTRRRRTSRRPSRRYVTSVRAPWMATGAGR
jgi:hypothetical protein